MDDKRLELLADNDREWRMFMIQEITQLRAEVSAMKAWNLVFRYVSTSAAAIVLAVFGAYVEWKFNHLN